MAKTVKTTKTYTNLYVKRRLVKLEVDIFGIISEGLLAHTPKNKILAKIREQIRSLAVHIQLDQREIQELWLWANSMYLRISKKTFGTMRKLDRNSDLNDAQKQKLRLEAIYDSSRAYILDNSLIKEANTIMYSYEQRHKHDSIWGPDGLIAESRAKTDDYSPFFLCSSHPKPAKDHADWEGKVYYDEAWEDYVPDDDPNQDRIRAYIRNRRIKTVQWVVGEPVYLTTRRNCRHYLKPMPLEEVLHSSAKGLLKRHNMFMPEEKPVSRQILVYREYYNRLKVEEALNELIPNQKLTQDIKRDKKLLDKWK